MAANHTSGAGVPRNPGNPIVDVEAVNISVQPDAGLNLVELTVTDATGDGLRTLFSFDQTLNAAMRMIGAIARLRGSSAHDRRSRPILTPPTVNSSSCCV
jgi:hypothetical protein